MIQLQQLRRPAKWIGYPAFALWVFIGTVYLALPRDRIRDRLKGLVSQSLNMDVRIDDFGLTLLTGPGVEAKNVELRTRPVSPTEKAARYVIDDVVIHFGVLDLLRSRTNARFAGHVLDGSVEGAVRSSTEESGLRLDVRDVNLAKIPALSQALTLPVEGAFSVKGDVAVPHNLVPQANGTIEIACDGCVIGDGKAKVTIPNDPMFAQGMTFPKLKLGRVSGSIVLDKGRATFKDVRARSPEIDVDLDGFIEVRDPIQLSILHLYVRIKPSDALTKREPTIELVNNMLGTLARRSDGALGFSITGALSAPLPLPSKEPPPGVILGRGGPAPAAAATAPGTKPTPLNAPPPFVAPGRRGEMQPSSPAPTVEFNVPEAPTPPPPSPPPSAVAPPPSVPPPAPGSILPTSPTSPPPSLAIPPPFRGALRPPIEGGGTPGSTAGEDGERERRERDREREREREKEDHPAPTPEPTQ